MDQQPVETTLYSLSESAPAVPERRADERHLSLFRVGALLIGDRRELCLVKNVSAGGMMIRAYCPIPTGTRLCVELKQGQPINGTVLWEKDDCVGLTFDEPIDVLGLLSAEDGPKPRMPRIEVDCAASVRVDEAVHRARALNISQGGAKIECADALPLGPEIVFTIEGLEPCRAVVRWSDGGHYGITFNRVLALPLLVSWLHERREQIRATG